MTNASVSTGAEAIRPAIESWGSIRFYGSMRLTMLGASIGVLPI